MVGTDRKLNLTQGNSFVKMAANNRLVHKLLLSVISHAKPKIPTRIAIEPFNVCNLRCKMCPYELMTRSKQKMNMDLFAHIVDDAVKTGITELTLSHYNEPLLDDLLFERLRYAKTKHMTVGFVTNGMHLTLPKMVEILECGVDRVLFSFDGTTKESFEKIRRGADFDLVKDNIIRFVQERNRKGLKKPLIYVCLVLQDNNCDEIIAFRAFWNDIVDVINISPVNRLRADISCPAELDISHTDMIYPCPNIWTQLTVLSSGKVALCCQDYDGKVVLGDLTHQSISEVWNSKPFVKIRQVHLDGKGNSLTMCANCSMLSQSAYVWVARTLGIPFLLPTARWLYYRYLESKFKR